MDDIDHRGFLSPELSRVREELRSTYRDVFMLCEGINSLGHALRSRVRAKSDRLDHTIPALLYSRTLTHYQASVLATERAMISPAEALARAALESTFALVAIARRKATVRDLVRNDEFHRLRLLNNIRRLRDAGQLEITPSLSDQKLTCCIERLKARRKMRSEIGPGQLARWAKLERLYLTSYATLSLVAHSNLRDMETELALDSKGRPSAIMWGPNPRCVPETLLTASQFMLLAIDAASDHFKVRIREKLRSLNRQHERVANRYLKERPL